MAWVKVPKQNHSLYVTALPKDRRVVTIQMFGGLASLVNGNMFGGLFGKSAIVKLNAADQAEAMKLDGAEPFDPMGTGRVMTNTVLLPESIMDEPDELRQWLGKAFDYVAALPAKKQAGAKTPAKKPAAKKPAANKPAKKAKR